MTNLKTTKDGTAKERQRAIDGLPRKPREMRMNQSFNIQKNKKAFNLRISAVQATKVT